MTENFFFDFRCLVRVFNSRSCTVKTDHLFGDVNRPAFRWSGGGWYTSLPFGYDFTVTGLYNDNRFGTIVKNTFFMRCLPNPFKCQNKVTQRPWMAYNTVDTEFYNVITNMSNLIPVITLVISSTSNAPTSLFVRNRGLACPNTNHSISPSFDQVAIFNPNPINNWCRDCGIGLQPRSTIPMPAVRLIVYLDNILANCRCDPSSIKLHTGNRIFISKGVKYGTGSEIPDLVRQHRRQ